MNVDRVLETLNRHQVDCLLIGGMNFLLRHQPMLTFDVDVWVADTPDNLRRCESALADWHEAAKRAIPATTAAGVPYRGIADEDMLACQLALPENDRKPERIRALQDILNLKRHE